MDAATQSIEPTQPIRVLITDDHAVVRKGIRALLTTEPDIEVVGEASDGRQAVAEAERLQPDVILMDIVMPHLNGIEATRQITTTQPEARILILTSFSTDKQVFPAIKAGALGYLLKDSDPEELVQAIRQVYRRRLSLPPTIAVKVLQELSGPAEPAKKSDAKRLTGQELDILGMLTAGQSNDHIADQLAISQEMVNQHINRILVKLHLVSRTQAVLFALQEGLASWEDVTPTYLTQLLKPLTTPSTEAAPAKPPPFRDSEPPTGPEIPPPNELAALRQIAADYQEIGHELALAGEIQTSFLPKALPALTGWELSATLEPAKETSGDFYDFIPLPTGNLGILIADVVGKGIGAALYMALSRTLFRTYALQYEGQPAQVLNVTNQRIQMDTQANMFVTVFYGVLNPQTGCFTYSSAGHNPPYILPVHKQRVLELEVTGPLLGAFDDAQWSQQTVQLTPGDTLLMYTDGITEARNQTKILFGETRLLNIAQANRHRLAQETQAAIIDAVHHFIDSAPDTWRDDMTLVVLKRDA